MARKGKCKPLAPKGRELPGRHVDDPSGNWQEFEVTYDECVRLVKMAKGRSFFLYFGWLAPNKDQTGVKEGYTKGANVSGNVRLSARELLRCLDNAYSEPTRAEYNVRVTLCEGCFFVGGA